MRDKRRGVRGGGRGLGVIAVAALLSFAGAAWAEDEDVARGRELAAQLCATCHLNPGQGEKEHASEIPGFRAVAKRPKQSAHGIVAWLRSAPRMMPNHHLTQDEMFVLAAYILSLAEEP